MTLSAHHQRRRRARIGADAARTWARELELGNPYAKAILLAIANYMNEDGTAWPGVATIARDTDIAENTVTKRLRWLEDIGAVALYPCWFDENGMRSYDAHGPDGKKRKATSTEIRFLFDADPAAIRARAFNKSPDETPDETGASPLPAGGLNDDASPPSGGGLNAASPAAAPQQPPRASEAHIYGNPDSGNNPPNPPSGGVPAASPVDEKFETQWRRFVESYPIPVTDAERARSTFAAMSAAEREDAITGALGYGKFLADETRRGRSRPAKDAHRWLGNRQWGGYLVAGRQAEEIAQHRFADEGSEQWTAWEIFHRICGRQGIPDHLVSGSPPKRRAFCLREWPPVGRGLEPDKSKWLPVFKGSGQLAAWCRALAELPNANYAIREHRDPLDGVYKPGLLVPQQWPPAKTQTQREAG